MRQVTGGRLWLVLTLAVDVELGESEPFPTDDVAVAAERHARERVAQLHSSPRPLDWLYHRQIPESGQRLASVEQWEVIEAQGQTVTPDDLRWAAAEDAYEDDRKGLS